jgi:hypothetical protein
MEIHLYLSMMFWDNEQLILEFVYTPSLDGLLLHFDYNSFAGYFALVLGVRNISRHV